MHVNLHWLDVPERATCKLVSTVHKCLHGKAPRYLKDYRIPVCDIALDGTCVLPVINWLCRDTMSARIMVVGPSLLRVRLFGTRWAMSCAIWRSAQTVLDGYSKLVCFRITDFGISAFKGLHIMRYINPRLTSLLYVSTLNLRVCGFLRQLHANCKLLTILNANLQQGVLFLAV